MTTRTKTENRNRPVRVTRPLCQAAWRVFESAREAGAFEAKSLAHRVITADRLGRRIPASLREEIYALDSELRAATTSTGA